MIIPVYRARFLVEALDSVFNQTRQPSQVLVIDDGSPDREALQAAIDRYPGRLTVLTQPNSGAGAARNYGIRSTGAELVALLDADDCWAPEYLERQLEQLDAHPECDIAYSDAVYVGDTPSAGHRFTETCPSRGEVTATSLLALDCHIPLSAVVARRQVLVEAGLFDPSLRRGQDFDLWLRLALRGVRFIHQPDVLMHHRIHDDNLSGSHVTRMHRAANVFRKALTDQPLTPEQRTIATRQIRRFEAEIALEEGKELLSRGDFAAASRALADAHRFVRRWKVGAALIGLRVAPNLFRKMYLARALQRA